MAKSVTQQIRNCACKTLLPLLVRGYRWLPVSMRFKSVMLLSDAIQLNDRNNQRYL